MSTSRIALDQAQRRLVQRLQQLEDRLRAGDDAGWAAYADAAAALAAILTQIGQENAGHLLSTRQLADRLGVSSKTVLRRRKAGDLAPALQLGLRGRAALRWMPPR
jgi:hypothetical protein